MQGPKVEAFEREFADFTGAPYACAVSSGTAALHLALLAVGVAPGDEVITVSHSFIATANSVRYCGANPVFVDIEPDTFNINPTLIERAITPKTRAILCVHQFGMPCDLTAILRIARTHELFVVEDAACAIGSEIILSVKPEKIGKPHSDIACFSFHPRKMLTTGDGGMIVTTNVEFDRKVRLWRQHGMTALDAFPEFGFNYRMTDLHAAVGREQLKRLPVMLSRRRDQIQRYKKSLSVISGLQLPAEPSWARSNWQSFCVRLPDTRSPAAVVATLATAGIAARQGIACAHRQPQYSGVKHGPLTESEIAQDHCLILPLYHQLTDDDQDRVIRTMIEACGEK
jgi:dTDP-4-amino-4,6-dideoxygalactose transaminase